MPFDPRLLFATIANRVANRCQHQSCGCQVSNQAPLNLPQLWSFEDNLLMFSSSSNYPKYREWVVVRPDSMLSVGPASTKPSCQSHNRARSSPRNESELTEANLPRIAPRDSASRDPSYTPLFTASPPPPHKKIMHTMTQGPIGVQKQKKRPREDSNSQSLVCLRPITGLYNRKPTP